MASKQEIKDLFTAELMNTPQYQIVLNIKQVILNEILTPSVQSQVIYNFETTQTDEEVGIIKMCMIIEFGFDTVSINNNTVIIQMKRFLE